MQLALALDPVAEALRYHDIGQWGWFSVLVKTDRKRQRSYPLRDLPDVLKALRRDIDSWISQGEFICPNRRIVNLRSIGVLFVDIDFYKLNLGITHVEMCDRILARCVDAGVPAPIVIYSGQGLQLKWVHKPIHRRGLHRWVMAQKALHNLFVDLGADAGAMDASRVLRIVGTVNSKTGKVAQVLFDPGVQIAPPFESLESALGVGRGVPADDFDDHPFSELEMASLAKARVLRDAGYHPFSDDEKTRMVARRIWRETPEGQAWMRNRSRRLVVIEGRTAVPKFNPMAFNPRRLAWDRLEDLRLLHLLRAGKSDGYSMPLLHYALNFAVLSGLVHPGNFWQEAKALSKEFGFGNLSREDELTTLCHKAKAYAAGERIEFKGRLYPPLYTPKNKTLIKLFGISAEEEKQLTTIISEGERRRRKVERDRRAEEKRRRDAGAIPRTEYESMNAEIVAQARLLAANGMSQRAISKEVGFPQSTIAGWLK